MTHESVIDFPLPAGAIVLDRFNLDEAPYFARWLERWRRRVIAGEPVAILISSNYLHALVVARPGPTRPLGERQLEL